MNKILYNQDKQYPIPKNILMKIQAKLIASSDKIDGIKRAKNLIKNGYLTYPTLKRLKNFFDYADPNIQNIEFELIGGNDMKNFVEKTLQSERSKVDSTNQTNTTLMPPSAMDNTLHGSDGDVNMNLNETSNINEHRNALAIIINENNKILIVKRAFFEDTWCPNKHALVGGKVEQGEEPIDGVKREVMEESGLNLEHFIDAFEIIQPNGIDYFFVAKAPKNQEVELNEEHTEYNWFSLDEIKNLTNAVPLLYEQCEMGFNKLNEKSIYN